MAEGPHQAGGAQDGEPALHAKGGVEGSGSKSSSAAQGNVGAPDAGIETGSCQIAGNELPGAQVDGPVAHWCIQAAQGNEPRALQTVHNNQGLAHTQDHIPCIA